MKIDRNSWQWRLFVGLDMTLKSVLLKGNPDTTISDYCWRHRDRPEVEKWRQRIDWLALKILNEENHCQKSFEADEAEP